MTPADIGPDKTTDLRKQKEEYEKQPLIEEYCQLFTRFEENYGRVVRALADAFGEELVLDTVERAGWEMGVEAGLTLRQEFDADIVGAFRAKARSWHDDPTFFCRLVACDVAVLEDKRWELVAVKCAREVFRKMGDPKVGLTRCITDLGAVRGWSPRITMRQPRHMCRGDNYCYQIREIVDDPSLQWDYSRQTSEQVGWRSIKALEELDQ